jgi:integrase
MSSKSAAASNILNRSPWLVQVRSQPALDRRFCYPRRDAAAGYLDSVKRQGLAAKLSQLETAFQLRLRRHGVKKQFITFDTWEQAEQARLQMEANLSVSVVRDYAIAARTTLRDIMLRYLKDVVPSHKGGDVESNRLRRLMRDEGFVDKKLGALCTEDLQDFITDRLTEVAPSTVDRDLDVISQVIRYADDVWKIAAVESPFKGLKRPKYFNERDRRLSAEEEVALLKAARADENPFVEPAIILALETSMRRSELLSLTAKDINLEMRFAFLKDTKNGRSRKVPLSSRAMQVIQALEKDVPEGNCLLDLSANALQIAFFRRVLPQTKIVDFHFHDLRHEAISRLAESGAFALIELQAISGHRDVRMLLRYAHLCAGGLARKIDGVSEKTTRVYYHRGRQRSVETSVPLTTSSRVTKQSDQAPSSLESKQVLVPQRLTTNVIRVDFGRRVA